MTDPGPVHDLARARELLAASRALFVLTGAGVSAESGVPTFRGAGGYWRTHRAEDLATPEAFERDPRLVWDWYLERRATVARCEPNPAHVALAAWAQLGRGVLITQNVDGLHERAGHPGVIRFHGSMWINLCTACGSAREARELEYVELPRSRCCGALERPGVVWFGEAIPAAAAEAAQQAFACADALLVAGTSAQVWPAAGFVDEAIARGLAVVEVNPAPSGRAVTVALAMPAGEALPAVLPR